MCLKYHNFFSFALYYVVYIKVYILFCQCLQQKNKKTVAFHEFSDIFLCIITLFF